MRQFIEAILGIFLGTSLGIVCVFWGDFAGKFLKENGYSDSVITFSWITVIIVSISIMIPIFNRYDKKYKTVKKEVPKWKSTTGM
jgi:hypothetical protein